MSRLKINRIKILSQTNEGQYGVEIPFSYGLNIIRADNSFGKSTCIQGIVYALGLEGTLGPSRKTPLKSALTTKLKKENGTYAFIIETQIYLEISNKKNETITIVRSSSENKNKIISVFPGNIKDANTRKFTDYFVRDPGAATRERGFHNFLEGFLGIDDPQVVKYDGNMCPLYLESIFSVNYVEQTRGWGGILNVLPTYLGIKELANKIIEYNLNLDIQENNRKRQQLSFRKSDLESIWLVTVEKLEALARQAHAFVDSGISHEINKQQDIPSVSSLYVLNNKTEKLGLEDYLSSIKLKLLTLKNGNSIRYSKDQNAISLEEELSLKMAKLLEQEAAISIMLSDMSVNEDYARSIDKRLIAVRESLRKYKDIQKMQSYGSTEKFEFMSGLCPTCNQPIEDSLLPHMHNQIALGVDDNIKYLEKQLSVFESLKAGENQKSLEKRDLITQAQAQIASSRSEIRLLKESLIDTHGAPSRADLREEILLEEKISLIEKTLSLETEIKEKLTATKMEWSRIYGSLELLPKDGFSANDHKKLRILSEQFKKNLQAFDYRSTPVEDFAISHRTYKPSIDDIDLGAEASASDNIRVIWAYLYSLLMLESHLDGLATNHLGLLVLDEPRQQETKEVNFKTFLQYAAKTSEEERQIIIATSEKLSDLQGMIKDLDVNLVNFEAPLISKLH